MFVTQGPGQCQFKLLVLIAELGVELVLIKATLTIQGQIFEAVICRFKLINLQVQFVLCRTGRLAGSELET